MMNLDRDASTTDEYSVTALQIFDYCGADGGGTLQVDALMDKFAPFLKTNKAESYLKSLLDPEHSNPEISVTKLAHALNQYSESQKSKVDFDESFNNSKSGIMPQDSDSGISTDGYQQVEELQSELREKCHLAIQLRSQLEFTVRAHEEVLATHTAERDLLRAQLNILREENQTLAHVRSDYEEVCDRLCASEQALGDVRGDLETSKKKNNTLLEQLSIADTEKLTLQELLNKSKEECHRINEMYASRQSALREQNETLKTEHAELTARLQDQEEFMHQIIKEKVLLEMELKEMVNKSNQSQLCMNRSIDVSYTEEQMLTALDPLSADSRFAQENKILEEEAFVKALQEEQGRITNMSLFDEIRLSLGNISRNSMIEVNDTQSDSCDYFDNSFVTIGTQTDEGFNDNVAIDCKCGILEDNDKAMRNIEETNKITSINASTQTEELKHETIENNNCSDCSKCLHCDKLNKEMQSELDTYDNNIVLLQKYLTESNVTNTELQKIVGDLKVKIAFLEAIVSVQKTKIDGLACDTCSAECQTYGSDIASVSTQASLGCAECELSKRAAPQRGIRRYLWESIKCLFQAFAVVMFVCAITVLYGVSRRSAPAPRCRRDAAAAAVPWRWFDVHEIMDLLLRIEYVADVPM